MEETMRIFLLALILAALPALCFAQDAAPAAAPAATYSTYVAGDFGFSVDLPSSGSVEDPKSQNWKEDPEVAFFWYGSAGDPVVMIQGRMDSFDTDLDAETFKVFCQTLLDNWAGEADNPPVDPAAPADAAPKDSGGKKPYHIVTANEELPINDMTWNLIEIADSSDPEGTPVYYSVFSTYAGKKIYTLSMYYLSPVSDEIQSFGFPVLNSFKLVTK
jgi:hypothetical protein